MNEAERLAYLEVMGIESYVPRRVLPGAKPSQLQEGNVVVAESPVEKSAEKNAVLKTSPLKSLQESLQMTPASKPPPVAAPATRKVSAPATNGATQVHVRFHWVIYQPLPSLLVMVPVAHTDAPALALLKKILAAMNVLDVPLNACSEFVWPPVSVAPGSSAASYRLSDARETLQAFLEGWQLKQKMTTSLRYLLVFDGTLGKTVFEDMSLPDVSVHVLPALHTMLTSSPEKIAEAKRLTWHSLKELKW